MGAVSTPNLDLLRVQETWQFAEDAFNRFIDDADNKLIGVAHLDSPKHWTDWQPNTAYVKDDIVRISRTKSHQYYQCLYGGVTDAVEPTNDVTGSIVTDGTVIWQVVSLSEADVSGGLIQIWLSGWYYKKGDAVLYGTALYRCKIDHTATSWSSDFIYWQEVCASVRMWKPQIYYFVDDVVIANNTIYKCITAHISDSTFNATEESNWVTIGGGSGGIGGAGNWQSGQEYKENQLVVVNGILYRANQQHTAGASFQADISKWDKLNANIKNWEQGIYYPQDTLVNYQGVMYKCKVAHTATTNFYDDRVNWILFHNPVISWENDNFYEEGQIVLYNGNLYQCNTSHSTSTVPIVVHPTKWLTNTQYSVGDVVIVVEIVTDVITGNTITTEKIYRCKTSHTSTDFLADIENWEFVKDLTNGQTTWQPNTEYFITDTVMYGGATFTCETFHRSSNNFLDDLSRWTMGIVLDNFVSNQDKWNILYAGIQEWKQGIYYKKDSMILYNNILFKCINGHKSNVFMSELANWIQVNKLEAVVSDWKPSSEYWESQLVLNDGILYRCKINHTSSPTKFIADYNKWDIVNASICEWAVGKEFIVGDIVTYNNLLYRCVIEHTATDFAVDANDWELLCGITVWTQNTTYKNGAVILHDGILYRVTSVFTSGLTFDTTNLEQIGGVGGAVSWESNTAYSKDQLVVHNKLLYRVLNDFISGTTFSDVNLLQLTMGWTAYWQPYTRYVVGETVVQANSILRCAVAHTSLPTYSTAEAVNWVMIASAQAIITYWTPNTQYTNGNAVIHNDILYICNVTHISSSTFAEDMIVGYEKWRTINTSATSGSWEQLTKMGVVAPRIVEIVINNTSTFCTSPVEVLKFRMGTQDETINEFTFIAGDGQKFTVDGIRADTNEYVIFDGQVRLKTEYVYPMILDVHTSNGYINISSEIDLSGFKGGEDMVVK